MTQTTKTKTPRTPTRCAYCLDEVGGIYYGYINSHKGQRSYLTKNSPCPFDDRDKNHWNALSQQKIGHYGFGAYQYTLKYFLKQLKDPELEKTLKESIEYIKTKSEPLKIKQDKAQKEYKKAEKVFKKLAEKTFKITKEYNRIYDQIREFERSCFSGKKK